MPKQPGLIVPIHTHLNRKIGFIPSEKKLQFHVSVQYPETELMNPFLNVGKLNR